VAQTTEYPNHTSTLVDRRKEDPMWEIIDGICLIVMAVSLAIIALRRV
jgi:hypothetical protein